MADAAGILSITELRAKAKKARDDLKDVSIHLGGRSMKARSVHVASALDKAQEAIDESVREAGWADTAMDLAEIHEKVGDAATACTCEVCEEVRKARKD